MSDNNDFGAFLSGFIIGGLVGAAVALLMAPQAGEETRTLIRERGVEYRNLAIERAEAARQQAEEAALQARHRAEELAATARTRAEELANVTREKAVQLQERGQVVLDEQKERLTSAIEAGKKAAQRTTTPAAEPPAEEV